MYSLIIIIIIPLILYLLLNIRLLHHTYALSQRISPQTITSQIETHQNNNNEPHIIMRLVRHSMCMFFLYLFGWTPYLLTMIVTSSCSQRLNLTQYFITWIILTKYGLILILFIYNKKLRDFLRDKFVSHCRFCCIQ